MGDMSSRRGRIDGMEARGGEQTIARVGAAVRNVRLCHRPAQHALRAAALFTMQFDHYEEVPKSIADKVIGKNVIQIQCSNA